MKLKKIFFICVCLTIISSNTNARNVETYKDKIAKSFIPQKPTVHMEYLITYKVWFLTLASIAKATVDSTEGIWIDENTSKTNKACIVKLNYYTFDQDKEEDRNRISLNDQILTVLTMPELNTILYIKDTDQYMNPLFKTPTISKSFEAYEMLENGTLDYFSKDFVTGNVSTNMDGAAELIAQGKGISSNIKLISEMYYGKRDFINHDSDYRVQFNVDGIVKPFSIKSTKEKAPVKLLGKHPDSIKIRAQLAKEASGKGGAMNLWSAPFKDIVTLLEDEKLIAASKKLAEWSIAPLVMDYDLRLGFIRCTINNIIVTEN
jgi:hypothetical protein